MQYLNPDIEFCLEDPGSVFKGLPAKDKEALASSHSLMSVKRGDFVFKEGDKSRGLICLASGKCKIFRIGVGGREQILRLIKPSDLIGYRNLFYSDIWNDSTVAIEDSVICIFEKQAVVRLMKQNYEFSFKIMKTITDELTYTHNRIISLTQKHVRGRLAETLLLLAGIYGFEADAKTINASLSRDDIAHYSNMTTSNAIRTLSNLHSDGVIEIKRRKIRLINIPGLEQISNLG